MNGNIPYMFYCWANPFVHLLLLKNSVKVMIVAACTYVNNESLYPNLHFLSLTHSA